MKRNHRVELCLALPKQLLDWGELNARDYYNVCSGWGLDFKPACIIGWMVALDIPSTCLKFLALAMLSKRTRRRVCGAACTNEAWADLQPLDNVPRTVLLGELFQPFVSIVATCCIDPLG